MGDREHQPEAPCQALRPLLDGELRNRDALAFLGVHLAHPWDAGESDAWDDEHLPGPLQARKRGGSHTELHPVHRILVGVAARKSVCRAACRPMSGLHLRVLCKWVAGRSAA